jgi:hypothetical protein
MKIFLIVLAVVLFAVVGAYPTKWIVNYLFAPGLLTTVFGTPSIGFVKAFFLNLFFGGWIRGGK